MKLGKKQILWIVLAAAAAAVLAVLILEILPRHPTAL
jgi:hypothetical protein